MLSFQRSFARLGIAVLLLLGLATAAHAHGDIPVRIAIEDRAELPKLLGILGSDEIQREGLAPHGRGLVYETRVSDEAWQKLRAVGWSVEKLDETPAVGRLEAEARWAALEVGAAKRAFTFPLNVYPSHAEVGDILSDIATAHPSLARTFSWGNSGQGRAMWGLVISDDVTNTEPEPEIRLASTIHGDETVGMILLLNFAEYLTTHYDEAGYEDVTALVDEHEIHFLPLHNPDGYVAGWRYDSDFVDLNRNFPEPAGTHSTQKPENVNFMNTSLGRHFVVSMMGHGGALVVNYPWDFTYTRAPDDDALIELSLDYSTLNLPMYNGSFSQGITNGADWYVVTGSLQDWSYDQTDCVDLTIELSNTKWPSSASLPSYWNDNRESLMALVRGARGGLHGVVTDANSGAPLDAVITVTGNTKPVTTDPAHGDWYKILADGTYEVTVEAVGYDPQTIAGVAVTWGVADELNVQLQPEATGVAPATLAARIHSVAPNPFNPATTVAFELGAAAHARLTVFDARGRTVRTLIDAPLEAGRHERRWDGRTDAGRVAGAGVYYVRLEADGSVRHAKAVLVP